MELFEQHTPRVIQCGHVAIHPASLPREMIPHQVIICEYGAKQISLGIAQGVTPQCDTSRRTKEKGPDFSGP